MYILLILCNHCVTETTGTLVHSGTHGFAIRVRHSTLVTNTSLPDSLSSGQKPD